jgi:hypothetical protein
MQYGLACSRQNIGRCWTEDAKNKVKSDFEKIRSVAWPMIINLWIGGVLAGFVVIRVIGSNTGKHLLKLLGVR